MNWSDYTARRLAMQTVLKTHFPSVDEAEREREADNLISHRSTAYSLERLEKANTPPTKDQERIHSASNAVRSAHNHLSKVGWHGQKTLGEVVLPLLDGSRRDYVANSGANSAGWDELLQIIKHLEASLAKAAEAVDLDGKSVMTVFDAGPEAEEFNNKKHSKTTAKFFSFECADAYFRMTGKDPTVSNRQIPHAQGMSNEAYGPFLDFVADAFRAAEVGASPETWAKAAVRNFRSKNDRKLP